CLVGPGSAVGAGGGGGGGGVGGGGGGGGGGWGVGGPAVEGGVDAADDRDAEGAAEEAGGVVDGGADAGLGLGDDAHDRFGCGGADEAHPGAAEDHLGGDDEVA